MRLGVASSGTQSSIRSSRSPPFFGVLEQKLLSLADRLRKDQIHWFALILLALPQTVPLSTNQKKAAVSAIYGTTVAELDHG
jgi:hypothetical protein